MDTIRNMTRQELVNLREKGFKWTQNQLDVMIRDNVGLVHDLTEWTDEGINYEACLWTALSVGRWNLAFRILDRRVSLPLSEDTAYMLAFASMDVCDQRVNDANAHDKLRELYGVNFDVYDSQGLSPFHTALRARYKQGVYFLLNHGLGLDLRTKYATDVVLIDILNHQDHVMVQWVCKKMDGIDFINVRSSWGVSPLERLLLTLCDDHLDRKFFTDTFRFLCSRFGKPHLRTIPHWMKETYEEYDTLFYIACGRMERHKLTALKRMCRLHKLIK